VRRSRLLAALAASVVLSIVVGLYAPAQDRTAPAAPAVAPAQGQPVALIDVGRIIKECRRYQSWDAQLKNEVKQAEAWVQTERETLKNMIEQLNELNPGTPQYKQKETEIGKKNADVTFQIKLQQKDFQERGATISLTAYREIQVEIERYATTYRIAMVQRFSAADAQAKQPHTVPKTLSSQVVWYNRHLDITDQVIRQINDRPNGGTTSRTDVGTRPHTAGFGPPR